MQIFPSSSGLSCEAVRGAVVRFHSPTGQDSGQN